LRNQPALQSDILRYIVDNGYEPGDQLPTIQEISRDMDVSVAKTRESLEVARALGIVEIKPGRGTRVAQYSFEPACTLSVLYAIGVGQTRHNFKYVRQLRNAIEVSFWAEATGKLTDEDLEDLYKLIDKAFVLLERSPIKVPADEHRAFHLKIFSRLGNPFVDGFLKAYWEAHDSFGLNTYANLNYHMKVWNYHKRIVDSIKEGNAQLGRVLLIEHYNLLRHQEDVEREMAVEVPADLQMLYNDLSSSIDETSPQPGD